MSTSTKRGLRHLTNLRKESEEQIKLIQIHQTLTKRLALVFGTTAQSNNQMNREHTSPSPLKGHTEQFNRVLVLWLDLQKTFANARSKKKEITVTGQLKTSQSGAIQNRPL